jgi:MFS transporter, ACS family, D-galactonate transporter
MATIAARRGLTSAQLLVPMLGAAVFINYVDRGAIAVAAPLMKGELGLSATQFGLAVSAFFWIYAPIQFVVGWLCDRFSVYRLLAGGILLWAGSTFLMGFVGGFASLFVLRLMLGVGESIAFPATSKIIARHIPNERRGIANAAVSTGLALGPAVGTLAGGTIVASFGWRPMFIVFGLATLLWLWPWPRIVRSLGKPHDETAASDRVPIKALTRKWSLWAMGIGHCLGNYSFYVLLAFLPLFLVERRGFSIEQMALLATLGYAVQAVAALSLGVISDRWTRAGRSEAAMRRWMLVVGQAVAAVAVLGIAFSGSTPLIAFWLCVGGVTTAALSLNIYAVAQMFAGPRASGTWVGIQNAIGNISGIVGPVISGIIIDRAGYDGVFILSAAIAAAGALWWAFAVPHIAQVEL